MHTLPLLTHTPDQTIALYKGLPVSVRQFLADVTSLAASLPAGNHLLNICNDRYHFTVGLAAAMVAGKISLLPPTNTPEMVRQLKTFANDVFCLHDTEHCDIELPQMQYPLLPKHTASNTTSIDVPQIDSCQCVAVLFTSGSTGAPMSHAKTWGSLVRNAQAEAKRLKLDGQTQTHRNPSQCAIIGTVPPQHMYGLESTVLLPLQSSNVLTASRPFYPADICSAIEAVPMSRVLVSSPVHLRLLLEAGLQLPEVRMVLSATAPLSSELAETVETGFNAPLLEIYGSTETGQIATRQTTQNAEWHLLPGVSLLMQGNHIWASGGHVDRPTLLNDIIDMTEAGGRYFLLQGRSADLINIAGKRSSLVSLNHQLNAIPGVIDGVFFMPYGEERTDPHGHVTRLSACVVAPTLNHNTLMTALRERIDPAFLPRPLLFVETLPRNSAGKLPRQSLEALFAGTDTLIADIKAFVSADPA